ncbi:MAG: iron ABC transporter permease, partial [Planctomycetes bacterium]|nr:iron ABC transporter permease [Planctomycetota bacterium]
WVEGRVSLAFFKLIVTNPVTRASVVNSLVIGLTTTVVTTLLALPLAFCMVKFEFRGKGLLSGLLLVPMIMPPFVGAIGIKQVLARYGSLNLLLMEIGVISAPVDWLGDGGFCGIVALETLHLYPIMYLNVAAALANVDPSLEEAGLNLGAGPFRLFRTITFPLMLPGYFAGASIVFIWAFTDLGTPLIFEYRRVVPVQIYDNVTSLHENPAGYALVVFVLLVTVALFYASKRYMGRTSYAMAGKGAVASRQTYLGWVGTAAMVGFCVLLIGLAILPHLTVFLTAITDKWFMTVLPERVTLKYFEQAVTHKIAASSIRNSVLLSFASTALDIALGVAIAYLLTRRRVPGREVLDAIAMLPLALPGLVLAFGYVACFSGTALDPRGSPFPLLIIAYAVRRLPYMVRAAYAGFQQVSVTLEEASLNLGAPPFTTLRKITVPLIMGNLIAGSILAFSFAMLEVSDSLLLAFKEQYYPMTKAIYQLQGRITDGEYIACAMGMLGMALLTVSLLLAGRFLGRRMGELFRA